MPKLTTNYSESLVNLIRSNDAPIDGMEIGPWFHPETIRQIHREFSAYPIQFHASSFITRYRYWPRVFSRLTEYHRCTQSKWVSVHIELLFIGTFFMSSRFGLHFPPSDIKKAKNSFIHTLLKLKNAIKMPIILENLPTLPQKKYAYAANPSAISDIVRETDSGFLLDIAHARIASSYQGVSVEKYLENLPLERTIQIHLSGPRVIDGYLRDSHESMRNEDYAIFRWALERTNPKVVTLEYFRELSPLREQLWKLREIIENKEPQDEPVN